MNKQEIYRSLKDAHRALPLFFQPWWLDIATDNWDVFLEQKEDEWLVFPYQSERKMTLNLFRKPLLCPYWGPVSLKNGIVQNSLSVSLLKQLPQWDFFDFSTLPFKGELNTDGFQDFEKKQMRTYILNLKTDEDTLFSGIQSRMRSYIRKAEKLLTIQEGMPDNMDLFVQYHSAAFERKDAKYPYDKQLIYDIIEAAENHQSSLFQTAYDENHQVVAMLWTPYGSQTAYHLLAAIQPECRINGAMALLVWNAIKKLKQQGLQFYDFEGSMDEGIASFFKKFGGEEYHYLHFSKNNSLIWKLKKSLLG